MANQRARSAGRVPPANPEANVMERLTEALQAVMQPAAANHRSLFKAPKFDGDGDVDYFIERFMGVAEASGWPEQTALLHLRESLRGSALECGKAPQLQGIFAALRTRFGLTPREARYKLI